MKGRQLERDIRGGITKLLGVLDIKTSTDPELLQDTIEFVSDILQASPNDVGALYNAFTKLVRSERNPHHQTGTKQSDIMKQVVKNDQRISKKATATKRVKKTVKVKSNTGNKRNIREVPD